MEILHIVVTASFMLILSSVIYTLWAYRNLGG